MTREKWLDLGPNLMVGAGIVASALLAVLTAKAGWWVMTAPLLLALAVAGAAVMDFRRRGQPGVLCSALLLGGSFVLASGIVALRNPGFVMLFLPILGSIAFIPFLRRPEQRRACTGWGRR